MTYRLEMHALSSPTTTASSNARCLACRRIGDALGNRRRDRVIRGLELLYDHGMALLRIFPPDGIRQLSTLRSFVSLPAESLLGATYPADNRVDVRAGRDLGRG